MFKTRIAAIALVLSVGGAATAQDSPQSPYAICMNTAYQQFNMRASACFAKTNASERAMCQSQNQADLFAAEFACGQIPH
jgi:predicted lipoprotein